MLFERIPLFALILVSLVAMPSNVPTQRSDCAKLPSTAEQADCVNRELAATESELKQTLKDALAQYAPAKEQDRKTPAVGNSGSDQQIQWNQRMRDDLNTSQQAWLKYRESACRAVGDSYDGGTFGEVAVPLCKADLARARIKFLRGYFVNNR